MIVVVSKEGRTKGVGPGVVGRGRPKVKEGGSCRDRWDSTVAIYMYNMVGTGEGPERDRGPDNPAGQGIVRSLSGG